MGKRKDDEYYKVLALEIEQTGISLTKLAERESTTRQTLSKRFKMLGIEIINQQNRLRFNENVFDIIDTEEKAYWLGFIYADGYISYNDFDDLTKKPLYSFELSLQLRDTKHLEKFTKFLNFDYSKVSCDSYRCRVAFANKHLWHILNNYGCTPRKSLTLKFPNIEIFKDNSLIKHFIRGYFDGDGCFSRYIYSSGNVVPHISFMGTPEFLEELSKFIPPCKFSIRKDIRHTDQTITYDFKVDDSVTMINFMYEESNIYLDRKYILYNFFKNKSRSLQEYKELLLGDIGEDCEVNTEIID